MLDILFYSKKREFSFREVAVRDFAREVCTAVAGKMESHGIEFQPRYDGQLGLFSIDADYLRAALSNILENAIQACEYKSEDDTASVRFTVSAHGREVCFEVADTGVGMDQDTRDRLFTVFFSTKGRGGTGLGLFVANQVVEQHGGRIEVQSQLGKGTTFRIIVPRSPA
jgi:signal transduction histidine kinase